MGYRGWAAARGPARLPGAWRLGILALIWGSNFLWIKLADRGLSPVEVTLARLVLGAAVLFTIVLARHEPVPRTAVTWAHITVAALFGNAVPYLMFALGEQTANSSTAGMLNATTPLWTVIAALATRHQRAIGFRPAIGLAAGFGGAVLIFTPWQTASGLVSTGAAEVLGAAVSYGISYVYMDRFLARREIGPVPLSACQLLAASVLIAIVLGATGAPAPHMSAVTGASVLVLGLLGTGIAYVLNYQIITSEGATVASTVTYLLPVIAIILGVLVLGEHITLPALAGIALILTGVALTRRRAQRPVRHPVTRDGFSDGSSRDTGGISVPGTARRKELSVPRTDWPSAGRERPPAMRHGRQPFASRRVRISARRAGNRPSG